MGDYVWLVPQERFLAAWNNTGSLNEAANRVRQLTGKYVPSWAALARALALRKEGVTVTAYPPMRGA